MIFPLVTRPPAWTEHALCAQLGTHNADSWFPHPGDNASAVIAICRQCPVVLQCREAGRHERWGIWGGRRHGQQPTPGCGTPGGYYRHLRNEEDACQACRDARNAKRRKGAAR